MTNQIFLVQEHLAFMPDGRLASRETKLLVEREAPKFRAKLFLIVATTIRDYLTKKLFPFHSKSVRCQL